MDRFEIEDIVSQDARGIVYRARIRPDGTPVSIRRFFPFDDGSEGLEQEEATAFGIAASRLAAIDHPSLLRVIEGSVDPIDGVPYLVCESIEGQKLSDLAEREKLEPEMIAYAMQMAMDASLSLSDVLGEEALWIDTDFESVVVHEAENGPNFLFWISPFKWLGADAQQRNLSDLVTFGERLAGWSNKLVGDQAGNGLGGWFKRVKANPDMGLREAMESLAAATGLQPTPEEQAPAVATAVTSAPIKARTLVVQQPSSKAPLIAVAAIALLVLGAALFLTQKPAAPAGEIAGNPEQESVQIIAPPQAPDVPLDETPAEPTPVAPPDTTASTPAAETPIEAPSPTTNTVADNTPERPRITSLGADQIDLMREQNDGLPIKVSGVLSHASLNRKKTTIVLHFEGPQGEQPIRGVLYRKTFKGPFNLEFFERFVGKEITLQGRVVADANKQGKDVRIFRSDFITLNKTPEAEEPEETEAQPQDSDLSPEDRDAIEALDEGEEVTLTGLFRSTDFSGTGKSLYLQFNTQAPNPVRGVIHQRGYPDDYSGEAFTDLIGKSVTLKGIVFKDNFGNPALVKVLSREDIVSEN